MLNRETGAAKAGGRGWASQHDPSKLAERRDLKWISNGWHRLTHAMKSVLCLKGEIQQFYSTSME